VPLFFLISAVVAVVLFGAIYLLARWTPADLASLRTQLVPGMRIAQSVAMSCGLLVAYFVMSRSGGGSWRENGLNPAHAWARLAQGAATGALMMSLLVGVLVLTRAMTLGYSTTPARALVWSGLQWAAVFVPAAFVEEMLFRGYPFFRLTRVRSPTTSAIIMSVAFGLAHLANGGEDLVGILQVIAIGLVFCLAVWRTGSLWWAIGAHAAWNWTQTFVFGCSNSGLTGSGALLVSTPAAPAWLSGGSTGPEGSVLAIPVMALMALSIVRMLPPRSDSTLKPASPAGS
jgi:membrane protease YdiL (CAAX protease family)